MSLDCSVTLTWWDGGRGHLDHVLSVAAQLRARGRSVTAVSSRHHYSDAVLALGRDNVRIVENRPPLRPPAPPMPVYSHAFRHAQRLRGLGFNDPAFIRYNVEQLAAAFKALHTSVVLNDYHDTVRIASALAGVPVVAVTKCTGNTAGHTLGWWIDVPPDLNLPDCRDSFNEVRRQLGVGEIFDEREQFEGDINVVPSCPELDPLTCCRAIDHYVGVLGPTMVPHQTIFSRKRTGFKKHMIFVYMGDANNRPLWHFDELLERLCRKVGTSIAVRVAGNIARYPRVGALINNPAMDVQLREHWSSADMALMLSNTSAVVCHGGDTALQAFVAGIPVISIPWNSESAWSWLAAKFGAALYLQHGEGLLERRLAPELGYRVEVLGCWKSPLLFSQFEDAIFKAIEDPIIRAHAEQLSVRLQGGGSAKVADLIENFI